MRARHGSWALAGKDKWLTQVVAADPDALLGKARDALEYNLISVSEDHRDRKLRT